MVGSAVITRRSVSTTKELSYTAAEFMWAAGAGLSKNVVLTGV